MHMPSNEQSELAIRYPALNHPDDMIFGRQGLITVIVIGDCGKHASLEEWQKCEACERIGQLKRMKLD